MRLPNSHTPTENALEHPQEQPGWESRLDTVRVACWSAGLGVVSALWFCCNSHLPRNCREMAQHGP